MLARIPVAESDPAAAVASGWATIWNSVRRNPAAAIGALILIGLTIVAVFAPLVAPNSIHAQVGQPFEPPSLSHLLGLDDGGIDMVSLLIWGCRISLLIGVLAALVATTVGTVVGIVAGYIGGLVDGTLMRITDYFLVLPSLALMIVVADLWGPSLLHIIIVIGILSWPETALVIRAQARSIKERVFVKRARALGATETRIMLRYVLPQVMPLVVANAVLTAAGAIFTETALSFLGLGDPSQISLGRIIENAFNATAMTSGAWWAIVPPGIVVAVIVLACSLIGRAIEDALNPRLRIAHLGARTFRIRVRQMGGGADTTTPS
jgi:peptide/nickel transport system permease protein